MGKPTSSFAAEMETLKEVCAALNRNDIPAMVTAFDPRIEWIEFVESPTGGTYRGLAEVKAHFSEARGSWAEGRCEPERFIVASDKIVVFVYVRVRLKHETEWREGRIADVYTFQSGKVIQGRLFLDRSQALKWAGASASDIN